MRRGHLTDGGQPWSAVLSEQRAVIEVHQVLGAFVPATPRQARISQCLHETFVEIHDSDLARVPADQVALPLQSPVRLLFLDPPGCFLHGTREAAGGLHELTNHILNGRSVHVQVRDHVLGCGVDEQPLLYDSSVLGRWSSYLEPVPRISNVALSIILGTAAPCRPTNGFPE